MLQTRLQQRCRSMLLPSVGQQDQTECGGGCCRTADLLGSCPGSATHRGSREGCREGKGSEWGMPYVLPIDNDSEWWKCCACSLASMPLVQNCDVLLAFDRLRAAFPPDTPLPVDSTQQASATEWGMPLAAAPQVGGQHTSRRHLAVCLVLLQQLPRSRVGW